MIVVIIMILITRTTTFLAEATVMASFQVLSLGMMCIDEDEEEDRKQYKYLGFYRLICV